MLNRRDFTKTMLLAPLVPSVLRAESNSCTPEPRRIFDLEPNTKWLFKHGGKTLGLRTEHTSVTLGLLPDNKLYLSSFSDSLGLESHTILIDKEGLRLIRSYTHLTRTKHEEKLPCCGFYFMCRYCLFELHENEVRRWEELDYKWLES